VADEPKQADRLLFGDRLDLVALPTAVACARLFTQYTLGNWRASFVMADALTVVGELVNVAVQETGVTDPATRWAELPALNLLTVRLLGYERRIRVEVWDSAGEAAVLPEIEGYDNLTGLHLVDATAHTWGSHVQPQGRMTWADLLVYPRTESGLPIRRRRRLVRTEPAELVDEGLLRRVRDGLDGLNVSNLLGHIKRPSTSAYPLLLVERSAGVEVARVRITRSFIVRCLFRRAVAVGISSNRLPIRIVHFSCVDLAFCELLSVRLSRSVYIQVNAACDQQNSHESDKELLC
jgi:hypothetical protein